MITMPCRFFRLWAAPMGMGGPAAAAQRVEAAFERVAAGECQNRIDTIGCKVARSRRDIVAPAVDGGIGAEAAHEGRAVLPRGGGEHPGAAQFRKLQCEGPDTA